MPDDKVRTQEEGRDPRVVELHSRDAEEHAGRLSGWTLRVEQFSAGRFSGQLTVLQLDHVQIIRERVSQALTIRGMGRSGTLLFSLPIAASGDCHFNGRLLPYPCSLFRDGADLPLVMTPRYMDVAHIVMDRQWLAEHFAGIGEQRLACDIAAMQHTCVQLSAARLAVMQQVFVDVFNACSRTSALDFARSRSELQSALLQLVADALVSKPAISVTGATSQKQVADRALAYTLSRRQDPPSVDDICRHIGVSRRNLQDCFRNAFGISPKQFLQVGRLNAVRRELKLLAAAGQRIPIGDVAASWGFWHWSRFAGNYRELFGELPSQTLQDDPCIVL
ncbi:helix-turn-helix domain-containing protein [Bradyrhizobium sp. KB893862 SZCCT0404]|uniref:helix-turn-helix domain-containing protein n=1 Tax=Bradyrhizobium sp. KB893862 SZCCT0404 TaxID=2807672 RepID=UPI001BAA56A1|nr:helix-turn-helix domain-containing protein [Bradyrhizobium sp. KB893862 SZCCT0404]MBR1177183.1 helix-turn-helix domain-containing protein [Bradyrhizobium sp. KB893862 SZCCT0404]